MDTDLVGDIAKISYRLVVDELAGPAIIEQVAYYEVNGEQISDLRMVCSGFRPA